MRAGRFATISRWAQRGFNPPGRIETVRVAVHAFEVATRRRQVDVFIIGRRSYDWGDFTVMRKKDDSSRKLWLFSGKNLVQTVAVLLFEHESERVTKTPR